MGAHDFYHFRAIEQTRLGLGDERDPFRFYSDRNFKPNLENVHFSIGVEDVDQNRRIDTRDAFYLSDDSGRWRKLLPEQGLKLLNYYLDPEILKAKSLGIAVTRENDFDKPSMPRALESFGFLKNELEEIQEKHFPFWEVDGHIDLNILQGARTYTQQENERWTGFKGYFIYWDSRYFFHEVLGKKGAIALSFISVENVTAPSFVWSMYTTNFFSLIAGSFYRNNRAEGVIEAGYLHAESPSASSETRRIINMETAKSRSKLSKDHLFWAVTWPIVLGACFADRNFRKFWSAPWRAPKFGVLYQFYAGQFNRALPFIGRSPFAWGVTALSAYQVYGMSSRWFEVYAGLPQQSTENKVLSASSTLFMEAALQARASREMEAVLGRSALNYRNALALSEKSLALRLRFQATRMDFFGLKPTLPKAFLELSFTEQAGNVLSRKELAASLARGETLLTERAGLAVSTRLLASAAEKEALRLETMLLRSRMRSIGLPLLVASAALGAGLGIYQLLTSED